MILTTSQTSLETALGTLESIVLTRLHAFASKEQQALLDHDFLDWKEVLLSQLPVDQLTFEEITVLTIALVPHVRPHFFDHLIQEIYPRGGDFPHFGGIRRKNHRGFIPTGETALFLIGGEDLEYRFKVQQLFTAEHWFYKNQVLKIAPPDRDEPAMSGQLVMDNEYVEKLTLGKVSKPVFSSEFPASPLHTELNWEDLVLPSSTLSQIQDLLIWLKHNEDLFNNFGMGRKLKPGYRTLFHGPPGTGKTMTANLLGKSTGKDVFRVDLSAVVSKYIGETEKNLSNLFDRAENKDWILFFDEADALFGSRTQVQSAHDRYANQEVSYLLQRVEGHRGLVILASNFKSNIDEAFIRRFHSIIHFPMPKTHERLNLWGKAFPAKIIFDESVDLKMIAQKYELTGADIMNVVHYVSLKALSKNDLKISDKDIIDGIRREFVKSGKIN